MHFYISLYIYIYIYIYNIESVLLKSISMIVYIYQGMMALGKGGGIHHGRAEKGKRRKGRKLG
jgi:hypothetical protein